MTSFVVASKEISDQKSVVFKYSSDSQSISAIRKDSKCHTGFDSQIELTGTIDKDTVLVIERVLSRLPGCRSKDGTKKNTTIYLDSRGGIAHDGVRLGRLFRKHNLEANIRNDRLCASACAFAFVGAKSRVIGDKSRVLFHSPFKKKMFGISCESKKNSQWLSRYFVDMLGNKNGSKLFEKTMENCSAGEGWVINNKSVFLIKIKRKKNLFGVE